MRRAGAVMVVTMAALAGAPAAAAPLANRCLAVPGVAASPVFFKPTGMRTFLLEGRDGRLVGGATPGPGAEFTVADAGRGRVTIAATASGASLVPGAVRVTPARGCRRYPEATVGAAGPVHRGLWGLADAHMHLTADGRAGGLVISGAPFDRYGITEALGHDADVHGPDGALDVTGNLLRSGLPVGTHDTNGWPSFSGWPTADTITHQQIYWRWLQRDWMAGLRLVVAQTVEDAPLCNLQPRRAHDCDETHAIELQVAELRALQEYVDAQYGGPGRGWFRIVEDPRQAAQVIRAGKLAVIIGIESNDPFGCSELLGNPGCDRTKIDAVLDHLHAIGVRSMFLAHWTDNALSGAALEGGAKGAFISAMQVEQTGTPFAQGACPAPEQGEETVPGAGRRCNTAGLTALGAYAVERMMDRHMIVEADHLSEGAREQVLAIAEHRHYPLVSSHTGTGGLWTPSELRRLYALGGFATATPDSSARLAAKVLALRADQGDRLVGVGLGTDTGGFSTLPGPEPLTYPFRSYDGQVLLTRERSGTRTFDLAKDGVAHYGLYADLLGAMEHAPGGRDALALLFRSAASYLASWRLTGA